MLELQTFYEAQNCSPLNMLSNATKFVTIQCQNQKIRFFLSKTNLRRKKKIDKTTHIIQSNGFNRKPEYKYQKRVRKFFNS
jgi:hypothetical protein